MKSEKVRGMSLPTVGSHDTDPFKARDKITIRIFDYLEEFTKAMFDSLGEGEKNYGNTWLIQTQDYPREQINRKLDRFFVDGKPINWAGVAGYAMIAWIRENHPELWNDSD